MDGVDLPSLGVVFFLKRKKGGLEARCSCFLGGRVDDGRPGHGLCVDPYLGFFFEKKSCLFFFLNYLEIALFSCLMMIIFSDHADRTGLKRSLSLSPFS